MDTSIRPFTLDISQQQLDDLQQRLALTRWPEKEPVDDWRQGIPLAYVQELHQYWMHDYDWRRWEKLLNQYPQFQTNIDDVDIHFLHIRSPHENALPLIMTHGWPGSIVEFHKVIEPLVNPTAHGGKAEDAFHLVLPSLPGYGFSGKPEVAGWNAEKIGRAWGTLMERLGYPRYVAQGGDWGAIVTSSIGTTEVEHCAGIHLNMVVAFADQDTMDNLSEQEQQSLEGMAYYDQEDSGYAKQQSTRPQTLGYGLVDSPIGQAAWIIEKFHSWMDCGEGDQRHPENILSKDELLDNVMMYWLPAAAASSGRMYWETFKNPSFDEVSLPTGASIFPKEIFRPSRRWAEKRFTNLIYWNELDSGGHFAAFEQPETFINEVRNCFALLR
jgi:pimeloyl-ACP methyl ester carboxylesterase